MKAVEGIMLISYSLSWSCSGPFLIHFLHFVQLTAHYVSCFSKWRTKRRKENVAEK